MRELGESVLDSLSRLGVHVRFRGLKIFTLATSAIGLRAERGQRQNYRQGVACILAPPFVSSKLRRSS